MRVLGRSRSIFHSKSKNFPRERELIQRGISSGNRNSGGSMNFESNRGRVNLFLIGGGKGGGGYWLLVPLHL